MSSQSGISLLVGVGSLVRGFNGSLRSGGQDYGNSELPKACPLAHRCEFRKPCNCAYKAKPMCDSAFLYERMRTSRCSVARLWITMTAYVVFTTTSKHSKSAATAFDM